MLAVDFKLHHYQRPFRIDTIRGLKDNRGLLWAKEEVPLNNSKS